MDVNVGQYLFRSLQHLINVYLIFIFIPSDLMIRNSWLIEYQLILNDFTKRESYLQRNKLVVYIMIIILKWENVLLNLIS